MLIPESLLASTLPRRARIRPGQITFLCGWVVLFLAVLPTCWQIYQHAGLAFFGKHTIGLVTKVVDSTNSVDGYYMVWFTYPEMPAGMQTPFGSYHLMPVSVGEYVNVTYVPHTRFCSLDGMIDHIYRLVFWLIFLCITLPICLFVIPGPLKGLYLACHGSAIIGHILASSESSHFERRKRAWMIAYEFELKDGRKYQGRDLFGQTNRPSAGENIVILYNPKCPAMNKVYPMLQVEFL